MKRLVFIALVAALLLTGYVVTRPRPEPVPVTFQAPPPTVPIVRWHWDFGDPRTGALNTSTEQNPVHRFSHAKTFTVTLTVWDANGNTATKTQYVTVKRSGAVSSVRKEALAL